MRIKLSDYTIAYCPNCNSQRVISARGITPCPECGNLLLPCSACQECLYDSCPYDGCTEADLKEHTNLPTPSGVADVVYKRLNRREKWRVLWSFNAG